MSKYLEALETPRELDLMRRRSWVHLAMTSVTVALICGGLELYLAYAQYEWGVALSRQYTVRAISGALAGVMLCWALIMCGSVFFFRQKRAQHAVAFEQAETAVVQQIMYERHWRAMRQVGEFLEVIPEHRTRLVRDGKRAVACALGSLLTYSLYYNYVQALDLGVWSYLLYAVPSLLMIAALIFVRFMMSTLSSLLDCRVRISAHRELTRELEHVRRELHGEALHGALTDAPEIKLEEGSLSMTCDVQQG